MDEADEAPEQLGGGRVRCPYCGLEMRQQAWGVHKGRWCKAIGNKKPPQARKAKVKEEPTEVSIEELSDAASVGASSAGDGADDVCAVCAGGDSSGDNLIVFCEGECGVAVHQRCYGIAEVPEGEWRCDVCARRANRTPSSVRCVLCKGSGGAFKRVSSPQGEGGRWAHVLCAVAMELQALGEIEF